MKDMKNFPLSSSALISFVVSHFQPNCMQAYHITCARNAGLHCVMKDMNTPHAEFTSYCDKHTPKTSRSKTASPVKQPTSLLGSVNDLRDPLQDLELVKKRIGRPPLSETAAKKKPKDMLPIIPTHLFHRLINTVNPQVSPPYLFCTPLRVN